MHPLRDLRPRCAPSGFVTRLLLTLAVTFAAVGTAQVLLTGGQLRERVLQQAARAHAADARVLQAVHRDDPREVRGLLGHVSSRPGVRGAALVGPAGGVVVLGMPHHGGDAAPGGGAMTMPMRRAGFAEGDPVPTARRAVLAGALAGRGTATDDPGTGDVLVAVPVRLDGGVHALAVVRSARDLEQQVAGLRRTLVLTLAAGLLLAVPAFYLLGGRALAARHADALDRSSRDALTGLGNHRSFHEEGARVVAHALRHDRDLTLALIDLDGFKAVNDSLGHRHGDAVLAELGAVLGSTRVGDLGFRIGGDEFALLLPETALEAAEAVLGRVREAAAERCHGATLSVGVAELRRAASDLETLIASADLALYDAKRAGRDRVVSAVDRSGASSPA